MKTEKLYEFLILSKTLNYSKAAENLYISQSVLSKHIKEIEQELGAALFYRTTHGVSLTSSGLLLAQKAESFIDHCNTAARRIRTASDYSQGEIRIACALELAHSSHVQVFISKFMERYPEISVVFEVKSEGTPEEILQNAPYDFIFTP